MLNNPVLILGYGREGKSVDAFLKAHYPEIEVIISDKFKLETDREFIDQQELLTTNRFFASAIKSPGIPLHTDFVQKLIANGTEITSLTNLFFQHAKGKTIGVTGTKGKSTTCALIASLLKEKYNDVRLVGNIGNPALDYLAGANQETIFVVELSSYQLETCNYSPEIAVLLEIHQEHLDYHQGFENYRAAKHRIYKNSKTLICHQSHRINTNAKVIFFSEQSLSFSIKANKKNIQAAIILAKELGLSEQQIQNGLANFKPLEHRLENIGTYKEITFYNDSLATIPEATIFALDTLGENVETLIAGGHDRGIEYEKLGKRICDSNIKTLILFPVTGEKILLAIKKYSDRKFNIINVQNMTEAVQAAFRYTNSQKICLLSPASSSLNLFKDYRDRAEQYISAIKKS